MIAMFMISNPKIDVRALVNGKNSDNAGLAKLLTDALNRSIRRNSTQLEESAKPALVTEICVCRRRVFNHHRDVIMVRVAILDEFPKDMRPIMVIPLFICDWIKYWPAHILRRREVEPGLTCSGDVTSGWRFITQMGGGLQRENGESEN